jgi:tetratricopeptide (TPR) repeat protein
MRTTQARAEFLERRAALLKRGLGTLSSPDLVELAFVQHRLRQSDEALATLRSALKQDPRSFWVQTLLTTISQATNQLEEAGRSLDSASAAFPDPWPGGSAAGSWFKQVESYQSKLLRLRLREGGTRVGRRSGPVQDVDALFPARFVGPSGQYEAGKIAESEKVKLPADAVAIVQQMILWFPDDTRLLWLLGELYNATGDVDSAFAVFQKCVEERRYDSVTLRDHRRLVKEARDALAQAPTPSQQTATKPTEQFLQDKATVWIVGGLSGAVLLALGWWQMREIFRRFTTSTRASS